VKIFLLGFMGSGKSYWAEKLAAEMNFPLIELDEEIEKAELSSISRIFEEKGENHFRIRESTLLKRFALYDDFVLSCGGGTPCFFDNMEWMNKNGVTVWINPAEEIIVAQLLPGADKRPLLKGMDKEALASFVHTKLEERRPFYIRADIICPTNELNIKDLKEKILSLYRYKPGQV
jgi:shikimate kinase